MRKSRRSDLSMLLSVSARFDGIGPDRLSG
jgi:hypothetical protein